MSHRYRPAAACAVVMVSVLAGARSAGAQETPPATGGHHHAPAGLETAQVHQHGGGAMPFLPRESSGTSWQPDGSPMHGVHRQARGWDLMLHGNVFVQVLHESAPVHRGATQGGSINWAMAMARRTVGAGRLGVRTMVSLEPWTIPGCGYPNLLQTGESCEGDGIHDKQHPHDLFMEAALEYDRPLTQSARWQVYGGLSGEPALGPPAFPHRPSAMPNPVSPIVHHWVDATHITFGVVTAGVYGPRWKVESSAFNGREPDEIRTDFDLDALDSVSARVSLLAVPGLALQASGGALREAEPRSPGGPAVDVVRATASATYHRRAGAGQWSTMAVWGANRENGTTTHAVMLESSLELPGGRTFFGRAEVAGKPAHDLHVHESQDVFIVGKVQGGYTRYLPARHALQPGIGLTVSAAVVPAALQPRYGGVGVGVGLFVTVRPPAHAMTP